MPVFHEAENDGEAKKWSQSWGHKFDFKDLTSLGLYGAHVYYFVRVLFCSRTFFTTLRSDFIEYTTNAAQS